MVGDCPLLSGRPTAMPPSMSPMVLPTVEPTASILHRKLTTANASIAIAERRAESARAIMEAATREATARVQSMQCAVTDAHAARRHAEAERDAACAPAPDRLAHVRALEMEAHEAKKKAQQHADCDALEEEARFRDSVARQARHCLDHGLHETPRPCHVHLTTQSKQGTTCAPTDHTALDAALSRILTERCALVAAASPCSPSTATANTAAVRRSASAAAEKRCDRYLDSVCADLKAGLQARTEDYAVAKAAGPVATRL